MSRALLSFLGGMGTGMIAQDDKNRLNDRQDRADAQNQQLFQAKMDEINLTKANRAADVKAAQDAQVNDNAATLDTGNGPAAYTMPNGADIAASDARQFRSNQEDATGEAMAAPQVKQGGFSVNGKLYDTRDAGVKAAADYNAPDARTARLAQAYRGTGRATEAMQLEAGAKQAKVADIQLSDMTWKRDMGMAMQAGHDGIAGLISKSQAGPMAGVTLKAVPSADNKTVTYMRQGADGTLSPIAGMSAFSNDSDGVVKAGFLLDPLITPEARMQHYDQQQQRLQAQGNIDNNYKLAQNSDVRAATAAGTTEQAAALKFKADTIAYDALVETAKIPAAVTLSGNSLKEQIKSISAEIDKATANGSLTPAGSATLIERQMNLQTQFQKLLAPYMPKSKTSAADPMGRNSGGNTAPNSYQDPAYDAAEAEAAQTVGIPPDKMRTIRVAGEASNADQVSPKGARTVYQFIPATRDAVLKKYGYDAYSPDINQQALAAAALLKEGFDRTGDWSKTFAGYNGGISGEKGTNRSAENKNYQIRTALADKVASQATGIRPVN